MMTVGPLKELWYWLARVRGGVFSCRVVIDLDVKERVHGDHLTAHIIRPFEHLWADVGKECIGGPPTQYHYLGG
jgi:hypothetical protein